MAALKRTAWATLAAGMFAAAGAGLVAWWRRREAAPAPAFPYIRDAGPAEQRDEDGSNWDKVDEASDESFPASDPPALS